MKKGFLTGLGVDGINALTDQVYKDDELMAQLNDMISMYGLDAKDVGMLVINSCACGILKGREISGALQ